MTFQQDRVQALINEIDAVLSKASPRLPWMMSGETIQQRQVLQKTRDYLTNLQQQLASEAAPRSQDSRTSPSTSSAAEGGLVAPATESAQQVLQAVLQEMDYLRTNMLQPLRVEVEELYRQRTRLIQEVQQLEAQRPQEAMVPHGEAQQQMITDFLQALMSRLQESLTGQVNQAIANFQAQASSQQALLHSLTLSEPASGAPVALSPEQRLERLQALQAQSDQLLLKLDTTLRTVFESLQRNVQSYHDSLAQNLDEMHQLGQQGEVMFSALVNHLAQQLGREASAYLQPSLDWEEPASENEPQGPAQLAAGAESIDNPAPDLDVDLTSTTGTPVPEETSIPEAVTQEDIQAAPVDFDLEDFSLENFDLDYPDVAALEEAELETTVTLPPELPELDFAINTDTSPSAKADQLEVDELETDLFQSGDQQPEPGWDQAAAIQPAEAPALSPTEEPEAGVSSEDLYRELDEFYESLFGREETPTRIEESQAVEFTPAEEETADEPAIAEHPPQDLFILSDTDVPLPTEVPDLSTTVSPEAELDTVIAQPTPTDTPISEPPVDQIHHLSDLIPPSATDSFQSPPAIETSSIEPDEAPQAAAEPTLPPVTSPPPEFDDDAYIPAAPDEDLLAQEPLLSEPSLELALDQGTLEQLQEDLSSLEESFLQVEPELQPSPPPERWFEEESAIAAEDLATPIEEPSVASETTIQTSPDSSWDIRLGEPSPAETPPPLEMTLVSDSDGVLTVDDFGSDIPETPAQMPPPDLAEVAPFALEGSLDNLNNWFTQTEPNEPASNSQETVTLEVFQAELTAPTEPTSVESADQETQEDEDNLTAQVLNQLFSDFPVSPIVAPSPSLEERPETNNTSEVDTQQEDLTLNTAFGGFIDAPDQVDSETVEKKKIDEGVEEQADPVALVDLETVSGTEPTEAVSLFSARPSTEIIPAPDKPDEVADDPTTSESIWYLGIDFGTTGLSAVLLNRTTGQLHPLYWTQVDSTGKTLPDADKQQRYFRLPTAVYQVETVRDGTASPTTEAQPSERSGDRTPFQYRILPIGLQGEGPLPQAGWETSVQAHGTLLRNLKPFLKSGIAYYAPEDAAWTPLIQWSDQQPIPLQSLQQGLQVLLSTIGTITPLSLSVSLISAAVDLSDRLLQTALRRLQGVIVSYPGNWPDTYSFNVREAILATGFVTDPAQIFFMEDAIAALLSALPDPSVSAFSVMEQSRNQLPQTVRSGVTLVLSAGASITELAIVDLPEMLSHLSYEDFTLCNMAYAGQSLDQDIVCYLLYPQGTQQLRQPAEEPAALPSSEVPFQQVWDWQLTFESTPQAAWRALGFEQLDLPRRGEPDLPQRARLQQRLHSTLLGQSLLEAARHLKHSLQRQDRFTVAMGQHLWTLSRKDLESQILLPYIQRLNHQLNGLLSQTGIPSQGVRQVICTGGSASFAAIAQWLRQKLPNATIIQDTYVNDRPPTCSRIAYGLVNLPHYPQVLNLPRQQYNDYFLLLELLRSFPNQPLSVSQVMQRLERRGINTHACYLHILALLEGHLPPGLIPGGAEGSLVNVPAAARKHYQAIQANPLFHKQGSQTYVPNPAQCQRLQTYLHEVLTGKHQTLEEPFIAHAELLQ